MHYGNTWFNERRCVVAHGTEEGLIPENVLHSFCTFVQNFVTSINDISLFGLFG